MGAEERKPEHLCVLIHGLWGNPSHLSYLSSSLREKFPESELKILIAKRNAGNFTYDGIELGGERVTHEIEDCLEECARDGCEIKKISIIGYSLGGLIARYAVGLLYRKGWFDKLEPVNFTTFATPHLGVRTPLLGIHNHLWNVLAARTLSQSGRQLFLIDKFRGTDRPLLSILADPDMVFIHALKLFKNKSLYSNIVNDRTSVYYTTSISKTDPYTNLDEVKVNFIEGYDPIIVDHSNPVSPLEDEDKAELPKFYKRIADRGGSFFKRLPFYLGLVILLPIAILVFLTNSFIQSFRSKRRIMLHEMGKAGIGIGSYRLGLRMEEVQKAVEGVFEEVHGNQSQEYLPDGAEENVSGQRALPSTIDTENHKQQQSPRPAPPRRQSTASSIPAPIPENDQPDTPEKPIVSTQKRPLEFQTLALAHSQFDMIRSLDSLGFRKYPVWIHNDRRSHAAMIVRSDRPTFDEGKIVVGHWVETGFTI